MKSLKRHRQSIDDGENCLLSGEKESTRPRGGDNESALYIGGDIDSVGYTDGHIEEDGLADTYSDERSKIIKSDLEWWRECINHKMLAVVMGSTGLTACHTESFSEFLSVWLRDICLSVGNIQMKVDNTQYSTTLSNYKFVGSPDPPSLSHSNNTSYLGTIYVDVCELTTVSTGNRTKCIKRIITSVPLCSIPIMLLSSGCMLSEDHKIEHQTEQELGGSFVVKGKRRYIPIMRTLLNNYPYTFQSTGKQQKYIQVRSSHIDSMHRSTSTLELYFELDKINRACNIQVPKLRIPFLSTAVSISIVLVILQWSKDQFVRLVTDLIRNRLNPGLYLKYEAVITCTWLSESQQECVCALNLLYGKPQEATTAQNIVQNEVLPHLNVVSDPCYEKGVYLAYMLSLLILFEEGVIPESDKDALVTTRVVTSAQSLASLYRIIMLDSMRQSQRVIRKNIKSGKKIEIQKIYKSSQMTSKLISAIATGVWSSKRKGVSHQLITHNKTAILAQMRKVSSSVTNTDGKHVLPRMVRADSFGYICAAETQEV
jgi:DNA-directed RNA polymerase beta subunit